MKILVVEDYPINQHIMKLMLTNMGHQCVLAENGKIAVELYQSSKFDLILMDLQMPIMDGFETTLYIRNFEKENQIKKTPIIALTAQILNNEEEYCAKIGTDGFMAKPVNRDLLMQKMEELVH